ncbi:MAG: hypothetical protein ABH842_01540 [Candidatus Micrarchaeota archaeon]
MKKSKKNSTKKVVKKVLDKPTMDVKPEVVKSQDKGGKLKLVAVAILFLISVYLALYFITGSQFIPGTEITQDEFKDVFSSADTVYIVMDVRQIVDATTSNGVLQCGVDFAASNGMGGKTVIPLSISDDGCIIQSGATPTNDCISMLKGGSTIYVKGGTEQTKYYSNGMVVSVSGNYTLGTCGIKVLN